MLGGIIWGTEGLSPSSAATNPQGADGDVWLPGPIRGSLAVPGELSCASRAELPRTPLLTMDAQWGPRAGMLRARS